MVEITVLIVQKTVNKIHNKTNIWVGFMVFVLYSVSN